MARSPRNSAPTPPGKGRDAFSQMMIGGIVMLVLIFVIQYTAREPQPNPNYDSTLDGQISTDLLYLDNLQSPNQTSTDEQRVSDGDASESTNDRVAIEIESIDDLQQGWIRIALQEEIGEHSSLFASFDREDNAFTIDTVNVERFHIDLSLLGAQKGKRFVMHIDGQNLASFPKEQSIVTYARSPEGAWIKAK